MITREEVHRGLVVMFDPELLLANGAAPDRPAALAVQGPHYFLCTGRCGSWSVWIPAFSKFVPGRIRLGYKSGSRAWVERDSFIDQEQQWIVPDAALGPASGGVDRTALGSRDFASWRFMLGGSEEEESSRWTQQATDRSRENPLDAKGGIRSPVKV